MLELNLLDPNTNPIVGTGAPFQLRDAIVLKEDQPAVDRERRVELRDLVPGGLVPVEVVFTVETGFGGGGAIECEGGAQRREEYGGVQDG